MILIIIKINNFCASSSITSSTSRTQLSHSSFSFTVNRQRFFLHLRGKRNRQIQREVKPPKEITNFKAKSISRSFPLLLFSTTPQQHKLYVRDLYVWISIEKSEVFETFSMISRVSHRAQSQLLEGSDYLMPN